MAKSLQATISVSASGIMERTTPVGVIASTIIVGAENFPPIKAAIVNQESGNTAEWMKANRWIARNLSVANNADVTLASSTLDDFGTNLVGAKVTAAVIAIKDPNGVKGVIFSSSLSGDPVEFCTLGMSGDDAKINIYHSLIQIAPAGGWDIRNGLKFRGISVSGNVEFTVWLCLYNP